jgi:hypothetical protein
MLRKWFCILLMLGFGFTNVYASDDDEDWDDEEYDDEEEILPATKKLDTKKKKAKNAAPSRIGLSAGFNGSPVIGLAYDMGSGIELGLGLSLNREQYTKNTKRGDDVETEDISLQKYRFILDFSYEFGKEILGYGIGAQGIISGSTTLENPDGAMDKGLFPYFYVSGELLKNVSLFLKAGAFINMMDDDLISQTPPTSRTGRINIEFQSSVGLTFYFI